MSSSWADDPLIDSPVEELSNKIESIKITPVVKKDDLRNLLNVNKSPEVKKTDLRELLKETKDDTKEEKKVVDKEDLRNLIKDNLVPHTDEEVTASLQKDTLYSSAATFESLELSEELLKGVYAMGFTTPSMIQARALPLLLAPPFQNLIAQSQVYQ